MFARSQHLIVKRISLLWAVSAMILLFTAITAEAISNPGPVSQTPEGNAYSYLCGVMDRYNLSFDIYSDRDAGGNHYHPTGWYNGSANMSFDSNWRNDPHSGCSCIRVTWNGEMGEHGWMGNGIMWQEPAGNWSGDNGLGYNLTGAETLSFWARTDDPGLQLEILVGYWDDSSGELRNIVSLDTSWTEHHVYLGGRDLSDMCGGFGFMVTDALDPEPDGCTFYLDDIRYRLARPDSLRLLLSYRTDCTPNDSTWAINQCYTYENALALLSFLARGTVDDLRRARIIGDAFRYAMHHDRDTVFPRLRNAYSSGDLADHSTGLARLPGWWDVVEEDWCEDDYQVSTYTGEMAWVIIAWLNYDHATGQARYLSAAESLASWIHENCYDASGIAGYAGGFNGPDDSLQVLLWKSTEHNLDLYVGFNLLYQATGDVIWQARAEGAWDFVQAMWDCTDQHYWGGTTDSGVINYFSPLDAQTWGVLASVDSSNAPDHPEAIAWAEDSCSAQCHYGSNDYAGFHFSTIRDGIWWEGTAQMCCAFQVNREAGKAAAFLEELHRWQGQAPGGDGKGIVACCPDSIWTGLIRDWGPWNYYDRLNVGATCWFIFAERDYNPYWHRAASGIGDGDRVFDSESSSFRLGVSQPNPFLLKTTIGYDLSKTAHVGIRIYDVNGRDVIKLLDSVESPGPHSLEWNGKDAKGHSLSAGVYFCRMSCGQASQVHKVVLLR